ncbi:DUF421 domain-containing protein [Mucilaginibacter sp. JRF]|uniref:DUF421 domain-containing protein n=1 Tax=Mucilaginibacter sp. JRF TaxID=2780088 RepID=UPI0018821D15|nr:YetF domain-containing protein [Mucilaginibacter sp. JRF]MBE9585932.1 DUF421 domain-containing protein [Mucilaginibacter sp. JRF]
MKFDWYNLFLKDLDLSFAFEIVLRTLLMFAFILILLRLSGKKGVRQLSIFEVAIIIALGSAAGDPMFNKEMAIIPSLLVFVVILGFYRLLTYFSAKSERFESILEGDPMYIIEDGMFTIQEETDNTFAKDEFFAEMRSRGIEHVGQVRSAILETNGQVSFLFFSDEKVRPGLPVLPKPYNKRSRLIEKEGDHACTFCAKVSNRNHSGKCDRCQHDEWVPAIHTTRIG